MGKAILILVCILIAQSGYKIMPVLAAEVELTSESLGEPRMIASVEIRKAIEGFLRCFEQGDLECLMSHVSEKFSTTSGDKTLDYNGLKLMFENIFKDSISRSIDNINVIEANVFDDSATILMEYRSKGLNLSKNKDYEEIRKVQYSLIKEGDSWKIVATLRMG